MKVMCTNPASVISSILWIWIAFAGATEEDYSVFEIKEGPLFKCDRLPEIIKKLHGDEHQRVFWSQEDTSCLMTMPLSLETDFSTILKNMQLNPEQTKIHPPISNNFVRKKRDIPLQPDSKSAQNLDLLSFEAKTVLPIFPHVHYTIGKYSYFGGSCIFSISETEVEDDTGFPKLKCESAPNGEASEWFIEFGKVNGTEFVPRHVPCDTHDGHIPPHSTCIGYTVVFRSADPRYQMYYVGFRKKLVLSIDEAQLHEMINVKVTTLWSDIYFYEIYDRPYYRYGDAISVEQFTEASLDFKIDEVLFDENSKLQMGTSTIPKMVVTNSLAIEAEVNLTDKGLAFDMEQDEFEQSLTNVYQLLHLDAIKQWFPNSKIDLSVIERKKTVVIPAASKCEIGVGHVSYPRLDLVKVKFHFEANVKKSEFDADGNFVRTSFVPLTELDPVLKSRFWNLINIKDEACPKLTGYLTNFTNELQGLVLPLTEVKCEPFVDFEHPFCDPVS